MTEKPVLKQAIRRDGLTYNRRYHGRSYRPQDLRFLRSARQRMLDTVHCDDGD